MMKKKKSTLVKSKKVVYKATEIKYTRKTDTFQTSPGDSGFVHARQFKTFYNY